MDMSLARKVARLIAKKRSLEDDLRTVKDQIAEAEPTLLNALMEEQMNRLHVTVDGQQITLYIRRIMWAKPKDGDREALAGTLKRCGMASFVTENYNSNSLSAYVRERLANGVDLQPTLKAALNLEEVVSIQGRRSPSAPESKTAAAMRTTRR